MESTGIHYTSDAHIYPRTDNTNGVPGTTATYTPEEKARIEKLKARDQEVRTHEQAHMRAAGALASGGPNYTFETGPDKKQYAVDGDVQIDTSKVPNDPEKTIAKAQQIQKAALAPADPSPQDRKVAAQARQMEMEARNALRKQQEENQTLYSANGQRQFPPGDILIDVTA